VLSAEWRQATEKEAARLSREAQAAESHIGARFLVTLPA
jgi:hypothetical protein